MRGFAVRRLRSSSIVRVQDFTGGAIQDQPARRTSNVGPEFEARIRKLVADWGVEKNPELIEELIVTALKMGREAHQGEIGLVIGDEYLAFRDFSKE